MSADSFTPQYDSDGNQTLIKSSTGIWAVTYNAENRPVRWECGNTVVTMCIMYLVKSAQVFILTYGPIGVCDVYLFY